MPRPPVLATSVAALIVPGADAAGVTTAPVYGAYVSGLVESIDGARFDDVGEVIG